MQLSDAIADMNAVPSQFLTAAVSSSLEHSHYLRNLHATIVVLESKIDRRPTNRRILDPEETWAKWRMLGYDLQELTPLELRTLCTSTKTAFRTRLIEALRMDGSSLARFSVLCGFVGAYFQLWRSMENAEQVEVVIEKSLRPGRITRKSKVLECWRKDAMVLFSNKSHVHLGRIVIRDKRSPQDVCASFFIDSATPLCAATKAQAAELFVAHLIDRQLSGSETELLADFHWGIQHLLDSTLNTDAFRSLAGKLILSKLPERFPSFQAALVSAIHSDDRLGDPRLISCDLNWRSMPTGSREHFLAWLAKDTLQFFFNTLVPQNDLNRRRAEFWLQYANKWGKIKDFQVAVSDHDHPKVRMARSKSSLSYARVIGGKTSAFLMLFEGYGTQYVVIEFSETGNAAYIYKRPIFESTAISFRSLSYRIADLKRIDEATDRIQHRDGTSHGWERRARMALGELGIRL